ncbi:MAG: dTMP kinase [Alphaproteobacteria bacterium]|nr:dTMP kinase [Alphaproteobacteria bacterium]
MPKGTFITFEGGEGAGKSTQIRRLAAFLRDKGLDVVTTREVGGCPSAEAIRDLWLSPENDYWDSVTELLLIMAARREHLVKTVFPALGRGAWVLSDRFADSTRAYQGVGLGLGLDKVESLYRLVAPDFAPDLTLLLDLPVEQGLARIAQRGDDDRYQQKDRAFHELLRQAYLTLAQKDPLRFRVIDASQSEERVADAVCRAVREAFSL